MRLLINCILGEVAFAGLLLLYATTFNVYDGTKQWMDNNQLRRENAVCEIKHRALLDRIQKEGLWKRLGMPGDPYLH